MKSPRQISIDLPRKELLSPLEVYEASGSKRHAICSDEIVNISMRLSGMKTEYTRGRPGFSLVELLVVIAIMAVLLFGATLAFSSLSSSQSIARTGAEVADIFQMARTHAMAQNASVDIIIQANGPDLEIAIQEPNGSPLARSRTFPRVQVRQIPVDASDRPEAAVRIDLSNGDEERFRFNSRGELRRLAENPPTRLIELGLLAENAPANFAAVQIQGLTGSVTLHRP